ncbi:MAG: hypothetical protein ACLP7Q_17230 [Isosphaeraceae bacterium]
MRKAARGCSSPYYHPEPAFNKGLKPGLTSQWPVVKLPELARGRGGDALLTIAPVVRKQRSRAG